MFLGGGKHRNAKKNSLSNSVPCDSFVISLFSTGRGVYDYFDASRVVDDRYLHSNWHSNNKYLGRHRHYGVSYIFVGMGFRCCVSKVSNADTAMIQACKNDICFQ